MSWVQIPSEELFFIAKRRSDLLYCLALIYADLTAHLYTYYLDILLQVEVLVHNCILHDHLCLLLLLLHCCYTTEYCHFPVEECVQGLLLCVCLCCVNSRWSTWVVRVGAPRKIFKPHSQISRLGMCGPSAFLYIPKDYLLDYFSRMMM